MIPIGDDQIQGGKFPIYSYLFIFINVLVYLYEASLSPSELQQLFFDYGCIPSEVLSGRSWHSLVTSMFLHGSLMHLIGNMMFLWVFGDNIEAVIGNLRFVLFYFLGGLLATAAHILFNIHSGVPSVGASGAIAAVLGAYLVMYPTSTIKMLVFFLIVRVPAFLFLGIWILQQFLSGVASLEMSTAHGGGVAWWAHIGGFVSGVLAGLIFRPMAKSHIHRYQGPVLRPVDASDRVFR